MSIYKYSFVILLMRYARFGHTEPLFDLIHDSSIVPQVNTQLLISNQIPGCLVSRWLFGLMQYSRHNNTMQDYVTKS